MKIALDYDNTYTIDPEFWNSYIDLAKSRGHEVRIVTIRDERFDRTPQLVKVEELVPIVYCRGIAKRWYLTHFGEGFEPDVWIDDKPETILANSTASPANLLEWREGRDEGPCQ